MASRLIQRSCRLLAASASFQPLPVSTLSECVRSCQIAPSFLPKASLHTSPLCSLADSFPKASPEHSREIDTGFVSQLQSATSVEEFLKIATSHQVDGDKSCSVIRELAKTQLRNKQEILQDQRFHDLLTTANRQVQRIHHNQLVMLLRSLHKLGVNRKDQNLQSVETEVLWRLRRLSIGNLAQLSSFLFPRDCTMAKRPLQVELVKQVELRWTEIEDAKTVTLLLFRVGPMSKKLMERLEDKVLELAAQFTPDQTKKIISALAEQGRRSLPVLRVLSFHLMQQQQELSTPVMLVLLSSFAKLNFYHTQLLEKMAKDLLPKLPELSPHEISWLIRCLSLLKFSSVPLFEAITQNCLERIESFSSIELCNIILNFANLNFHPNEELFRIFHQRVSSEMDTFSFNLQLELVFSLCILSHVTTPLLQRVLEPQFYGKILEDASPKSRSHCWKLLQINATAQLECRDYEGPLLPRDVLQSLASKAKFPISYNLQKSVQDALKIIYPAPEACRFSAPTVYGWQQDCEVVLDSELHALPLNDLEAPHCPQSEGTQPLPKGARRLVVVCRDFQNFCVRSNDLLGKHMLNRRLLRAAGFLVVEVPYYDWQDLNSEWLQQSYLKDQIKKAVAEDMAR